MTLPPGTQSALHSQYSVGVCDMAGYHSGFVQDFRLLRRLPNTPRNVARSAFNLKWFRGLRSGERKVLPVQVKRVYRAVQKQPNSCCMQVCGQLHTHSRFTPGMRAQNVH